MNLSKEVITIEPSVYESADKINCPVCGTEFIPSYYHIEKNNFELESNLIRFKITKNKNQNGINRPKKVIRKSWITSCPQCFYVLRFAAEVNKKRLMNGDSSRFHIKEFKENNKWFKYEIKKIDKPFEEKSSYDKKYLIRIQKEIVTALEDLKLFKWGILYKKWTNDFSIDSFKFLIRFCSNFDAYCEELNEWTSTQGMEYKIEALELTEDLKEIMMKVEKLRLDSLNNYYELNNKDEKVLRTAFLKLMFELIHNRLKNLKLDDMSLMEFDDNYEREIFILKLEQFIETHIEENLGLKNELHNFIKALFLKLNLPSIEIAKHFNPTHVISKIFKQ